MVELNELPKIYLQKSLKIRILICQVGYMRLTKTLKNLHCRGFQMRTSFRYGSIDGDLDHAIVLRLDSNDYDLAKVCHCKHGRDESEGLRPGKA